MTTHGLANHLSELAQALRTAPNGPFNEHPSPLIQGEHLIGAALFWSYLRDLITASPRDVWPREDLLVLLETLQRDRDLFLPGMIEMIAATWESEGC